MKLRLSIPLAILCLASVASCIKDDLDPCPAEGGGFAVTLRVEKFGTQPSYGPSDFEERFGTRIHTLDYLLYADERLIERGRIEGLETAEGSTYLFRHDTLPFGSYRLALAANATQEMMAGDRAAPETYCIVYQGEERGDDHFRVVLPLEVTCPYRNEFETVLRRVHGVTRFVFENLPPQIVSVEVSLDGVGERIPLSGEPDRARTVAKRVPAAELQDGGSGSFTLGTFNTLPGMRSAWRLRLWADDPSTPVYDRLVTDTLRIERNRLLELKTVFREGDLDGAVDFSVEVDTAWDGSNPGGSGESK